MSLAFQIDDALGNGPHTALVAGGSQGIGGGYVDRLADAGCDVIVISRSVQNLEEKLQKTRERIAANGGSNSVTGIIADLSRPDCIESITRELSVDVDIAVFAAGNKVFDHQDAEAIERMIAVKRDAAPRLMSFLADEMRRRPLAEQAKHRGLVLLVSSVSALHEIGGLRSYSESNRHMADLGQELSARYSGELLTTVCFPGWVEADEIEFELGRYHPGKAWGTTSIEQVVADGLNSALRGEAEFIAESDRANVLVGEWSDRVLGPGVSLAISSLWIRLTGTRDQPGPLFDSPLVQSYSTACVSVARAWVHALEAPRSASSARTSKR